MRRLFFGTVIILATIALLSCSKSNDTALSKNESKAEMLKRGQQIGIIHNEVLSEIISPFQANSPRSMELGNISTQNGSWIIEGVERYVNGVESLSEEEKEKVLQTIRREAQPEIARRGSLEACNEQEAAHNKKLTNRQRYYIDKFSQVVNANSGKGVTEVADAINELEISAMSELSSDELQIVLIALEVGKHSYEYWSSDEGKSWQSASHGNQATFARSSSTPEQKEPSSAEVIAKADLDGAVDGAGSCLIGAALGGPATLAAMGACIGITAAIHSAKAAIEEHSKQQQKNEQAK